MTEDRSVLTRSAPPPGRTVRYADHPDGVADVYDGSGDAEPGPLVVAVHGGFWRPSYDRVHVRPLAAALADEGRCVASVEYRRTPGRPDETLDDVRRAVADLPGLVAGHDGRAVVVGHSAGGHLALWAGSTVDGVEGVVALAPVADLRLADDMDLDLGAVRDFLGCAPDERPDVDPLRRVPRAPTVVVHGIEDEIVPVEVSLSYVRAHDEVRLVAIPRVGHFALIDPTSHAWPDVLAAVGSASDPWPVDG